MMASRRALIALPLAALLAFGSTAALSGCSVQGLVKNVTHGHVDLGGKSVPADFPKEYFTPADVISKDNVDKYYNPESVF